MAKADTRAQETPRHTRRRTGAPPPPTLSRVRLRLIELSHVKRTVREPEKQKNGKRQNKEAEEKPHEPFLLMV